MEEGEWAYQMSCTHLLAQAAPVCFLTLNSSLKNVFHCFKKTKLQN